MLSLLCELVMMQLCKLPIESPKHNETHNNPLTRNSGGEKILRLNSSAFLHKLPNIPTYKWLQIV